MLTFKKGDSVKYLNENSKLIPIIEAEGWKLEVDKKTSKEETKPKKKK
jgi:hypothetical protein